MRKYHGFTLIEIILVMAIISIIMMMAIGYMQQKTQAARIDKTSLQMQQILNAGLAFYVLNGKWPSNLAELQTNNFLPSTITNPWGVTYTVVPGPPATTTPSGSALPSMLYVWTSVTGSATSGSAYANATIIAGKLPLAFTTATKPTTNNPPTPGTQCTKSSTTCYVAASVSIPGQNLNNASAVNFAGIYHHGACVPAPTCPINSSTGTTLKAEVFLVPVSVGGFNDTDDKVYPISSFTAYPSSDTASDDPPKCSPTSAITNPQPCGDLANPQTNATYWRACLYIVTERGPITSVSSTNWGSKVWLAAFTRCAITNEPAGSKFDVYSN